MPYKDPEKQRAYMREWIAKRRANWLAENGPCVKCGSWENLEVDHIDPAEKVHHALWSWSQARRDVELAKCQVLCHDHHLEKTRQWHYDNVQHGSLGMYYRGCRCDLCSERKRRHNARRKYDPSLKKSVWDASAPPMAGLVLRTDEEAVRFR